VLFLMIIVFLLLTAYRPGDLTHILINWLVAGYFLLIIVIDTEHHLVLHLTSIAGALLLGTVGSVAHSLLLTIIGGLVGFLVMLGVFLIGHLYSKYKTRKSGTEIEDAVGFGDVTFGGVCGLLVGWPNIIPALVIAIIMGGLWSVLIVLISMIRKKTNVISSFIAYAPFFAISTGLIWIVLQ
jgi:prepilin signal peptidase PulO-like enzyme (type II secretory pathway)